MCNEYGNEIIWQTNYITELDKYRFFNRELRSFLLQYAFYSVKEGMMLSVVHFSL